jgi:hypothetical protein
MPTGLLLGHVRQVDGLCSSKGHWLGQVADQPVPVDSSQDDAPPV